MKLNCKRIDFTYTPGEEIFNFPEESGLPFIFDVEEELTGDPAAMDAVGKMLDEAEKLAEKAKAAIKAALADEDSRYHSVVTFFMEFHRDDVGPDIAAELFPGTDPAKLSFAEMVDFLKLKRFGSLVDDEMNQQVFIMDLSFNPAPLRDVYALLKRSGDELIDEFEPETWTDLLWKMRYPTLFVLLILFGLFIHDRLVVKEVVKQTALVKEGLRKQWAIEKKMETWEHASIVSIMSSMVAHELKQPLGAAAAYCFALRRRMESGEVSAEMMEKVFERPDLQSFE